MLQVWVPTFSKEPSQTEVEFDIRMRFIVWNAQETESTASRAIERPDPLLPAALCSEASPSTDAAKVSAACRAASFNERTMFCNTRHQKPLITVPKALRFLGLLGFAHLLGRRWI